MRYVFSLLAIALTFAAFIPYILSIRIHATRPHVFSWVIWGASTMVVFIAQLADGGGAGAWPIGISGGLTLYIAVLAWQKRADIAIYPQDKLFLLCALMALPFWWLTANPLWTVVILTTVDFLGFLPTLRKTWQHPEQENRAFYAVIAARNLLAIVALENLSITTVLFPAVTGALCCVLIGVSVFRLGRVPGQLGE